MTTFKRARSEEQRAERRRRILDTAAAMLTEMPVAQISLNELSRRVCLAKSNVLRYFESREAVLLELLDLASRDWLDQWAGTLAADVDATADPRTRGDQLAASLAASLAARPVLCDLVSAQAAVLEHNVSTQVAIKYKRSSMRTLELLTELVLDHLPELGAQDAERFVAAAVLVTGALWPHARPAAAMLAAYEVEPALAVMRIDFTTALRETLEVLISGLLARAAVNP
jgi:AcrR family transcriptional regulator